MDVSVGLYLIPDESRYETGSVNDTPAHSTGSSPMMRRSDEEREKFDEMDEGGDSREEGSSLTWSLIVSLALTVELVV
ncbi:hypothetical protein PV325_006943 [Microctonus aethiopoides]|nr:hypothetical protein PV325_006943 [Microctonus aethiopoides]